MLNDNKKILIVGPCSAESAEQVLAIAQGLESIRPLNYQVIFRAGIWKPRTSPTSFQGAGDEALKWLQAINWPTSTEVATPEHVKRAIAAGIQYLWIGARTSANPIAVQAIADCLPLGAKIMVKNPVNEDVDLWIGNILRLEKAGAFVMAIHRGCGHKPRWHMAFELRRRRPDIPLLLDPSHMSGDANQIATLCQTAMDLQYDGLMIEVHTCPSKALSDGKQQITPLHLHNIITQLHVNNGEALPLLELRKEMDEVDDELWNIMAKRMDVSKRIGEYKKSQGIPVLQSARYEQIVQRRVDWANNDSNIPISEEAIRQIMDAIHKESVRVQS